MLRQNENLFANLKPNHYLINTTNLRFCLILVQVRQWQSAVAAACSGPLHLQQGNRSAGVQPGRLRPQA
jgi:hypothetical protein